MSAGELAVARAPASACSIYARRTPADGDRVDAVVAGTVDVVVAIADHHDVVVPSPARRFRDAAAPRRSRRPGDYAVRPVRIRDGGEALGDPEMLHDAHGAAPFGAGDGQLAAGLAERVSTSAIPS